MNTSPYLVLRKLGEFIKFDMFNLGQNFGQKKEQNSENPVMLKFIDTKRENMC